jgi:sirohydrochlorin ferrochelatase
MATKTALLLIAHGSRQPEANDDLHDLAARLRTTGRYALVEPAFLELAAPTIDEAARRCVEQGAGRVILLPYFLSAGVHVQRDLQGYRDRLAAAYPAVAFALAEPLGRHPLLTEVVIQRADSAEAAFDGQNA